MKKYIYTIIILLTTIITLQTNAQIKINSDGQIKIFGENESDDPDKDLSMQVYGKYGSTFSNAKIGIGDYGRVNNNGANVFIGELGTNWDSDRLDLHGKNGIYLTYQQGYDYNNIVGKWDINQPDRFQFNVDVYAKGIKLNSDEKFKTNIKPLGSKLDKLKQLKGISYELKSEKIQFTPEELEGLTEKEQADIELLNKPQGKNRKRLGFLAQDVQELFPELVEEDKDGYLYVDYVGLIPVLVESVKEQQEQIDELLELAAKKGLLTPEK